MPGEDEGSEGSGGGRNKSINTTPGEEDGSKRSGGRFTRSIDTTPGEDDDSKESEGGGPTMEGEATAGLQEER